MDQTLINTVFRPKLSKQEEKADTITRAVRALINSEASAREAKTERLRTARLARDTKAQPIIKVAKRARRRG